MTRRLPAIGGMLSLIALTAVALVAGSADFDPTHWPQWRGPFFNGVAKGPAPNYHRRRLPQPDNFKASPVAAGGDLYLASESGVITVIKLGEKFEVVATNTLADHMFVASPAVAEGEMFLRSKTQLFCVSDGKSK
jgi:hypothetical protein